MSTGDFLIVRIADESYEIVYCENRPLQNMQKSEFCEIKSKRELPLGADIPENVGLSFENDDVHKPNYLAQRLTGRKIYGPAYILRKAKVLKNGIKEDAFFPVSAKLDFLQTLLAMDGFDDDCGE